MMIIVNNVGVGQVNDPVQNRPVPAQARCTFQEGSLRCARHALPAARYCLAHVLHDPRQVPAGTGQGLAALTYD